MYPGTLLLVLLVIDSGVLVGLLRGGRLAGLRVARLQALPLLVAALVPQLLLGLPLRYGDGARWGIGSMLLVASLLLLLLVARANPLLPGMPLIELGLLVNLLVVGLNGAMPVSTAPPQYTHTHATSVDASHLGAQYVLAGPKTRLPMLGEWIGFLDLRAGASIGDFLQYAGLVLLIQGLMVRGVARRPKPKPRPKPPPSPWATLLRVAWLAILLGLLLQLALLLVAAGFGTVAGSRPLLAETCKTVCWSLLVCVGIALGRVAAKGRLPLAGVSGLLAAPLALTAANTLQKGVAEALNAAGTPAGPPPLWVLAIKAAEYACLGLALEWIGRRAWGSALGYMAAGLLTGVIFGGAFLTLTVASAHPPLPSLLAKGVNELLFPVGCALVVFIAEVLATHLGSAPADDQHPRISLANAGEQARFPFPVGVGSRPVPLTVGPPCELERGHWVCVDHRRGFASGRALDRHIRLGEHRLVWLCWAHGPEQPRHGPADHPGGHSHPPERTPRPLAKGNQLGHRRSA